MTARPAAEPRLATPVMIALIALAAFASPPAFSEPVVVKHTEGIVHGFLVLRTLDGVSIADGDLIQSARGDRVTTRLKTITPGRMPTTWSFVAATPKPRLVKLALSAAGTDRFVLGRTTRDATHYVVKIELGGVSGILAPLVGKQPPDAHVWILGG